MEIVAVISAILLTIINVAATIIRRQKKLKIKKLRFSQSILHNTIKYFLPSNSELKKPISCQSRKHDKQKNIKVLYTPDQKAYWVVHNTFYCADLIDGELDPSTGNPVNVDDLSKQDIEKLLFILDNLNG